MAGDNYASEARTFEIFSANSAGENLSSGRVFAIYNFPSNTEFVSQARIFVPAKRESTIDVSEVRTFAIVRGRTANPKIRIWEFTLDAHDMVVLRLGDASTLVYDLYSEQWIEWDSFASGAWRANAGLTWIGAEKLGWQYGSNIVVGDDTFGLLWFLDPTLPYDEAPDPTRVVQEYPFDRIVTGQVLAQGRQFLPCYVMFLDGDNYGLTAGDFDTFLRLDYSDDQGRSFITASGTFNFAPNPPQPIDTSQYQWTSIGQISSPGRIFRIVDNGALTRIDALSMNDE